MTAGLLDDPRADESARPPRLSPAPLLTAVVVAARLNISLRSVRRMIADGRLPCVRIGHVVRVRPEAVAAIIEGK